MEIKFENEREFLIGMAEMFISSRQMNKAIDAVELLSKKFPVDGVTRASRHFDERHDDVA